MLEATLMVLGPGFCLHSQLLLLEKHPHSAKKLLLRLQGSETSTRGENYLIVGSLLQPFPPSDYCKASHDCVNYGGGGEKLIFGKGTKLSVQPSK